METKELLAYLKGGCHSLKDIAKRMSLEEEEAKKEIQPLLDSGVIFETLKGYMLTADCHVGLGTLVLRKDNYGFISPVGEERNKKNDIRVAGKSLVGFILGDEVYFQVDNWDNGTIVGLYKRVPYLAGTCFKRPDGSFFLKTKQTENSQVDVHVQGDLSAQGVSDGDLLRCKVISSATDIIETSLDAVLAKASDVGADISAIIASNDAPLTFPPEVLTQARMIPQEVSAEDLKGREDYRDECIVTIDGADALDFDDAVSCKKITNGYQIGVYIADVSYYVRPNTPLDTEAVKRGTSIYVADRVVPMLPKELSNGICSLNPHVDRLVLSVIMDVDESGNVYRSKIAPGVINSHGRLTYQEVNELFKDNKKGELSEEIVEMLFLMKEATHLIRRRRERQGALDLESTELKFTLDEKGTPTEVIKRTQGEGEDMIEDLMIIANVEVAKFLSEAKIPTLYRVHDNPPSEKIEMFKQFLKNLKMFQDFPKKVTSSTLSHWFSSIDDPDLHRVISGFLLRSLAKAKYSPDNTGHFGLAEENYLHFTSPIRRYPDLIVHRTLRNYVFNKESFDYTRLHDSLENLGVATSACEKKAVDIEREVDDLESCKYMANHIGEEHDGLVTGINAKGLFLELDNGIEAFVAIQDIDPSQRWDFSEAHMDIQSKEKDENDRLVFIRLGTPMKVIVVDVTMEDLTIHAMSDKAKQYQDAYGDYRNRQEREEREEGDRPDYSRFHRGGRGRFDHGDRDSSHGRSYGGRGGFRSGSFHRDSERPYEDRDAKPENEAANAEQNAAAETPNESAEADNNVALTRFVSDKDSMDTAETKRRMENTDRSFGRGGHSSYGHGGHSSYGHDGRSSYGRGRDERRSGGYGHREGGYGHSSYGHAQASSDEQRSGYSDKEYSGHRDSGHSYGNSRGGYHKDYHSDRGDERQGGYGRDSYQAHGERRSEGGYGHSSHSSYGHGGHSSYGHEGHSSYGDHKGYGHSDDRRSEHRSFNRDDRHSRGFHKSSGSRGGYRPYNKMNRGGGHSHGGSGHEGGQGD